MTATSTAARVSKGTILNADAELILVKYSELASPARTNISLSAGVGRIILLLFVSNV